MWGEDVHRELTIYVAKSLGFSAEDAAKMAAANMYVDSSSSSMNPVYGDWSRHFDRRAYQSTSGNIDTRLYHARNEMELAVAYYKDGNHDLAFQHLGYGLHSLQDMYAHMDWDSNRRWIRPHGFEGSWVPAVASGLYSHLTGNYPLEASRYDDVMWDYRGGEWVSVDNKWANSRFVETWRSTLYYIQNFQTKISQ
jgi:hypothetical protein